MKHDYVRLNSATDRDVSSGGTTIKFEKEEMDTGADHTSGDAAVVAPYDCTMSGVVQVKGTGHYSVEVKRYYDDNTLSASFDESHGGWSNSPFSNVWNKGDVMRVVISALEDGAKVSNVRLYCDIHER